MKALLTATLTTALVLTAAVGAPAAAADPEAERAEIRSMAQNTLARLYEQRPIARQAIESAAGYAVFSNFGLKIFLFGSGMGKGVAVDNQTGAETFMKMIEVQAGVGLGGKKFRVVFVFENTGALNKFINEGWELGAQTTAAAKYGEKGEALQEAASVSPGVWMFQLTDSGLAAEITAKGTKYYKDDELN